MAGASVGHLRDLISRVDRSLLWGVLAVLILFYAATQPPVQFDGGHPYDSASYYHMAEQVAADLPVAELRPFASRIALPWLVGTLFPSDLHLGFRTINFFFALAGLLVLGLFLREFKLDTRLILILLILYVSNPNSPFRFVHFLPAYTDPPALFFMSLVLLLGRRLPVLEPRVLVLLSVIGFIGALFREIVICAVLVVSFTACARLDVRLPFVRIRSVTAVALALLPLAATLAGILLANGLVESTGGYRYAVQMTGVVRQLLEQPAIYPLAWLTAFGVVPLVVPLVVLLRGNRHLLAFLGRDQDVLLYLAGMALVAATVGFHTDRLVFWCYPAVLLLFGKVLASRPLGDSGPLRKVLFFAPLVVLQILAQRVFLPIPADVNGDLLDPGKAPAMFFSVYGEGANLGHFYASSMLPADRVTLLLQFSLAAIYLAAVLLIARPEKT